ncbi:hypothetical protein Q0Z83_060420 [Actinoplanes sichuanensis]|nr:hypothetical protein Q0Z83_060420 [Actinoplanes sichuanensis]
MRISEVLAQLGPTFTARYESECSGCAEVILPGDNCRADGAGGWIHTDNECHQIHPEPRPAARPACTECFQVPTANGSCGCF